MTKQFTKPEILISQAQDNLQSGRQIAWWVIFILEDIIAFVDGVKEEESISHAEQGRQAPRH